uniref:phosphoacetylglucosamine mutase n=1 Tax=Strigamia maritima TaxID=126957 RepID=T1IIS7_STRMM
MADGLGSVIGVASTKHPKTTLKVFHYGTAGFRSKANELEFVMFRMGLLAALRSKSTQAAIGVMITASHNPEDDNGVKLVDPMGDMLESAWEILATHVVNAEDVDLVRTLNHIIFSTNLDMSVTAKIIIGRDTRKSSLVLSQAVIDGVKVMGGEVQDFGLLITPQLHYVTCCTNTSGKYGVPTEEGYYKKLGTAFVGLRNLNKKEGDQIPSVRLDCANGVGAQKIKQMLSFLKDKINVEIHNSGGGKLNDQCGADYVKIQQKPPENFPLEAGFQCASFDGDGDRIVYFYLDSGGVFHLLDGDKIAALICGYLQELLSRCKLDVDLGVVQTAYANGNATEYIATTLNIPVACVPTGVKHLHHRAMQFDIGVYFEANGHGTVVFKERIENKIKELVDNNTLPAGQVEAALKLKHMIDLTNQTVGDAISDCLLVEAILNAKQWSIEDWDSIYSDLPSRQIKVVIADRSTITTTDAERRVVEPSGLQSAIDTLQLQFKNGRAFVRPSGTEDIVRVYAEADTQEAADKLANAVGISVYNLAGGVVDLICVIDHMMEDYDTLINELNIVKRKLESKVQALYILNQELKECQEQRDRYKAQAKHSRHHFCTFNVDEKGLNQMITSLKETNKNLESEVNDLRQKITESKGDNKLLREQLSKHKNHTSDEASKLRLVFPQNEREELIQELETLKTKCAMIERDLQIVLDEREEFINEKDAYKNKVDRLNHQLNYVLKGDEKRIVDVDTLVMENRYLQERLKQIQEEKSLYLQTLSKYKQMLEKRRNHGNLKIGANNGAMVITHRQVQKMLQSTHLSQLPTTQTTIADLRSLALALFESLNDKNVALSHQKKANKILGNRVTELENKIKQMDLQVWENENSQITQGLSDINDHDFTLEEPESPTSLNITSELDIISLEEQNSDDLALCQKEDVSKSYEPNSLSDDKSSNTSQISTKNEQITDELPPALLKLVEEALSDLNNFSELHEPSLDGTLSDPEKSVPSTECPALWSNIALLVTKFSVQNMYLDTWISFIRCT